MVFMNKKSFITRSETDTIELGRKMGKKLRTDKGVVTLLGDLGTGKTTFLKGVAEAFGVKEKIKSPTFVLLKEYNSDYGKLVHVDAYRLEHNFEDIGLEDYFIDDAVFIEWADRLENLLPKDVKRIYFEHISENERKISW